MAVTISDVRHIAGLARLELSDARAATLLGELNAILGHMEALSKVDTVGVTEAVGVGARGLTVRDDDASAIPMARSLDVMVPLLRDGFLLVPRLATHEATEEA